MSRCQKDVVPDEDVDGEQQQEVEMGEGSPLSVGDQEETSAHTITKQIISRSLLVSPVVLQLGPERFQEFYDMR